MTGEGDRGEAVRLAGTVLELSSPAFASTTVAIDGERFAHDQPGWVLVDVAGQRVRVDAEAATAVGRPSSETTGPWGELRERTALAPDLAPTFKVANVAVFQPAVGDRVEVYGEVAERGPQGEQDYREAPVIALRRVRATLIACGDGAAEALTQAIAQRSPPRRRAARKRADPRRTDPGSPLYRPSPYYWMFAGVFAAAAAGVATVWGMAGRSFVVALLATAALLRPTRDDPSFRARADEDNRWSWTAIQMYAAVFLAMSPLGLAAGVSAAAMRFVVAGFIVLLCGTHLRIWAGLAPHRRLLAAKPWRGKTGDDLLVEGTVRDPTPVTIGARGGLAMGRVTGYDKGLVNNPDTVTARKFHNVGTFLIDTADGVVEVDPDELVWASTVVDQPVDPSWDYEIVEVVPIGGKVAAVGSLDPRTIDDGPPRLRARRTVPAVLFATSKDGDPRGLAAAMVRDHVVTAGMLAILTGLAIWACV